MQRNLCRLGGRVNRYSNKDVGHEVGKGKEKSALKYMQAETMIASFFIQTNFQTPLE